MCFDHIQYISGQLSLLYLESYRMRRTSDNIGRIHELTLTGTSYTLGVNPVYDNIGRVHELMLIGTSHTWLLPYA